MGVDLKGTGPGWGHVKLDREEFINLVHSSMRVDILARKPGLCSILCFPGVSTLGHNEILQHMW